MGPLGAEAGGGGGEGRFFDDELAPQRFCIFFGRRRQTRKRRLRESLEVANRREAGVAEGVEELDGFEGVEPGVEVAEEGRLVAGAGDGVLDRLEGSHAVERLAEEVGPEAG